MTQLGRKIVWGIPLEYKPILPPPDAGSRLRFRFRNTKSGEVFIKSKTGIERFVLLDHGETWGLMAQGRNVLAASIEGKE